MEEKRKKKKKNLESYDGCVRLRACVYRDKAEQNEKEGNGVGGETIITSTQEKHHQNID